MTALEYMEKQAKKHHMNLDRESIRGVPNETIHNIGLKISYYEAAVEALKKNFPAADVEPVVQGRWVDKFNGEYANATYHCSACGESALSDQREWFLTNYCHNCGARMDGGY